MHSLIEFDCIYLPLLAEFGGEEEPDVSVPLQVSEDTIEDDISSRSV